MFVRLGYLLGSTVLYMRVKKTWLFFTVTQLYGLYPISDVSRKFKMNNGCFANLVETKKNFLYFSILYLFLLTGTLVLGFDKIRFFIQIIVVAITLQFFPILFKVFFIIFGAYTTFFFSVCLMYGEINYGMVVSLFNTNIYESVEFAKIVFREFWIYNLIYGVTFIFLLKNLNYLMFNRNIECRAKILLYDVIYLIFALYLFVIPNGFKYVAVFENPVTKIFFDLKNYYLDYKKGVETLQSFLTKKANWHYLKVEPKYKNYVIVIGESARKDYMNLYGFKLKNTPFFSKTNGFFIDGYVSAGSYTLSSLLGSLYLNGQNRLNINEFDYSKNIISLANGAGFATTWVSNQGFSGNINSFISLLASLSHKSYFTQRANYDFSEVINDENMYPYVDKALNEDVKNKPRLIVIHIMGSHADFCSRIKKVEFNYLNKNMSCYVTSIYETDKFLKTIVDKLKNKNETWSLIYFSDHGLRHLFKKKDKVTLVHSQTTLYKSSVDVPFAKISSDDNSRTMLKVKRSAFNFMHGFSSWTGIKVSEINNDNYNFFGDVADDNIKILYNKIDDASAEENEEFNLIDYDTLPKDDVVTE